MDRGRNSHPIININPLKKMEELLKQVGVRLEELGVRAETLIISLFAAILFVLYRIYEPETPPTRRVVITIIIRGMISGLLVPGLLATWLGVDNPYVVGLTTGMTIYAFEKVIAVLQRKLIGKLENIQEDGNGTS